ncbi:hypothetical protein DP73_09825 [Desulfosporosinus sp. HMP52]|nr:hypothetical protein DP73_09825 [Desulfosporosinus sp. HMP52]
MKYGSFDAPTDYYCEHLTGIDEQICELLAKRKELSNNKPGFPGMELINAWCERYALNKPMLLSLFGIMYNEPIPVLQEQIEPDEFLRFVPILKSVQLDDFFYAVTYMKQYKNASVVSVEIELDSIEENVRIGHAGLELFISPDYQCRPSRGGGDNKGMQHSFIVTPSLPDDVTNMEFKLTVRPHNYHPKVVALAKSPVTIK